MPPVRSRHILWVVLAVLWPTTPAAQQRPEAAAQAAEAESVEEPEARLRELEAKYEQTGEARYLYERVLTLEEMGEYQFALSVLREHRRLFEESGQIRGVALLEQRLEDAVDGAAAGEPRESSGGKATGWILVGGGLASIGGGVTGLLVAESNAKRLRCSPASLGPEAPGCDGVSPYDGLSSEEFDRKSNGVSTLRGVGIGLTAVGVGLAGYGVIRLLIPRRRATAAESAPAPLVGTLLPGGAAVQLRLQF